MNNRTHISENVGYTQRTISKAAAKFGKLPEVLTEYYSQLGKRLSHIEILLKYCCPVHHEQQNHLRIYEMNDLKR